MATPKVYCEINDKGMDAFYLIASNNDYIWLFNQDHRNGVYNYFRRPRTISEATDHSKAFKDGGLRRTIYHEEHIQQSQEHHD